MKIPIIFFKFFFLVVVFNILNTFTYQLKNVIRLNSIYSIRLYELLKQYEKIGYRSFEIDTFRDILQISKGYRYNNIKNLILKSQKELSEKTDLSFTFKESKQSRKVVSITFYIEEKKQQVRLDEVITENQKLENVSSKLTENYDLNLYLLLNSIPEQHRKKKAGSGYEKKIEQNLIDAQTKQADEFKN
jgi:plasmid replication initiation protein